MISCLALISVLAIILLLGKKKDRSSDKHYIDGYASYDVLMEDIEVISRRLGRQSNMESTISSIGNSLENVPLQVLTLSQRNNSLPQNCKLKETPLVWITCGIHAREWISPYSCLFFIKRLGRYIYICVNITGMIKIF